LKATVFYSWQSDTPGATNRNLILQALEDAAKEITSDESINVEPVIDRDTQDVPGSPDIGRAILDKINAADVVVADVTIINQGSDSRLTPNPNVLVEVGYALAVHSESRLILVQNLAFGTPEQLPFDLRQKRALTYTSHPDATERASDRRKLQSGLRAAVGAVLSKRGLSARPEFEVNLYMDYRLETNTGQLHEYILDVVLKNTGTKRIDDWHVDIEVPTPLLRKVAALSLVRDRSNDKMSLFRITQESFGEIYPGDSKRTQVSYRMDSVLFGRQGELFGQLMTAKAYVAGQLAAEIQKPVREMQRY
jgi:hypothetical protein